MLMGKEVFRETQKLHGRCVQGCKKGAIGVKFMSGIFIEKPIKLWKWSQNVPIMLSVVGNVLRDKKGVRRGKKVCIGALKMCGSVEKSCGALEKVS